MDNENPNPDKNTRQLAALFGKAKLVATCDGIDANMVVFFSSRNQLERAKASIEKAYNCVIKPGGFEDKEGCHGLWVPIQINKLVNKTTGERKVIRTSESDYLAEQVRLEKIQLLHATNSLEFYERLMESIDQIATTYKKAFKDRGMNQVFSLKTILQKLFRLTKQVV